MCFLRNNSIIFLVTIFLLSLNLSTQAQQEGELVFRDFPGYSITDLYATDDGGYLFLATFLSKRVDYPFKTIYGDSVYLWGKVNNTGVIEFAKNITIESTYIHLIEKVEEDHFLIIAEQPIKSRETSTSYDADNIVLMNMDATGNVSDSTYYENGNKINLDCLDFCSHFEPNLLLGFEEDHILLFGEQVGTGYDGFSYPAFTNIDPDWLPNTSTFTISHAIPDTFSGQVSYAWSNHKNIIQKQTSDGAVLSFSDYSLYYWVVIDNPYYFDEELVLQRTGKYLVKSDVEGGELWAKTSDANLPIEEQIDLKFNLAVTSDGGFILLGTEEEETKIFFYKYDANGDFLQKKELTLNDGLLDPVTDIYRLESTSDNGFILVYEASGTLFLQKLNKDGDLRWEMTYGEGQNTRKIQAPIIADDLQYTTGGYYEEDRTIYPYLLLNQNAVDNILLAIDLHYFTAKQLESNSHKIKLEWSTAVEKDISHFEVERSQDGIHFEAITRMESKNNETRGGIYTYVDELPISPTTTYYYRLKVIEQDGRSKQEFLATVDARSKSIFLVNFDQKNQQLQVEITESESLQPKQLNLYQIDGRLYESFVIKSTSQTIPLHLPSGIYVWEISSKGEQAIEKGKLISH